MTTQTTKENMKRYKRSNNYQHYKVCKACKLRFYLHRTDKLNLDSLNNTNLCWKCFDKLNPSILKIHIGELK